MDEDRPLSSRCIGEAKKTLGAEDLQLYFHHDKLEIEFRKAA